MKDNLIFPVADMLNMDLHEMGDGKVRGAMSRRLPSIGGLPMDAEVVLASDENTDKRASFLVRLHRNIWLYVVTISRDGNIGDAYAMSFDGEVAGIKAKDVASYGLGHVESTITKIGNAIRKSYVYRAKGKAWEEAEELNLAV